MGKGVSIYLVDDDAVVRHATLSQLASSGYSARAFDSAEAFLASVDLTRAGVLLLDQQMGGMSGLRLQEELRNHNAVMPVIFITGHADIPMSVSAMRSGAMTVLEKPLSTRQLIECLEEAIAVAKEQDEARRLRLIIGRRFEVLTPREQEIMEAIVAGQSNRVLAERLGIAVRTVESHRYSIMRKMHANTLPELVLMASVGELFHPGNE
jgi:FixJ family two-component response regulator